MNTNTTSRKYEQKPIVDSQNHRRHFRGLLVFWKPVISGVHPRSWFVYLHTENTIPSGPVQVSLATRIPVYWASINKHDPWPSSTPHNATASQHQVLRWSWLIMKERKVPDPSLNPGHGPALSRICLLVLGYPCDLARHERLPPPGIRILASCRPIVSEILHELMSHKWLRQNN